MNSSPDRRRLLHERILGWFDHAERALPWRGNATPWAVMVSEFMLQQTPVVRVLPIFETWMRRWPTPAALAVEPAGEAVRAWGRLGYPRRAMRLHAAATAIVDHHGGKVPNDRDDLRALPGVGEYTATAVASFAFDQSHPVLDTNVRRVLARLESGVEFPARSLNAAERELAHALLPTAAGARWSAALMELGALVCTARKPRCVACPVHDVCVWRLAGYPAFDGPPRRGQTYAGTDRQCRGMLLQLLRDSDVPVSKSALDAVWNKAAQRERALDGLVADGLIEPAGDDHFALPGTQ